MIPLYTERRTVRAPVVTGMLLAAIVGVWIIVQGAGLNPLELAVSVCNWGLVPAELTHRAPLGTEVPLGHGLVCIVDAEPSNVVTPLTSMFLHGSWGHIIGNAIFLRVFGGDIEDSMGRSRFVAFYLACGLAAGVAQVLAHPESAVPMVGASGAISGVMGAYLVLFPRVRVHLLVILLFFVNVISVPAWLLLIYWFALQVIGALPALSSMRPDVSTGIAVWAHIGGFGVGALLSTLFTTPHEKSRHRRPRLWEG